MKKLPLLRSDEGRLRKVHLGRDPLLQFVANVGSEEADGGGVAGCSAGRERERGASKGTT